MLGTDEFRTGDDFANGPTRLARDRRGVLPAWLLSLMLHLLLMLSLPWWRAAEQPAPVPWNRASIVMVQDAGQRARYLDAPEEVRPRAGAAQAAPGGTPLPSTASMAARIPADVALPAAADVTGSGLLTAPRLRVEKIGRVPGTIDADAIRAERAALREAREARGPEIALTLFDGRPAIGRSFVFLIDRSKSMGRQGVRAMEAAEAELLRALESLTPRNTFQVIAYHDRCVYLGARRMLQATEENKQAMRGHLTGLAAFGATNHEMALKAALHLQTDVIYLLTDGGDPSLDQRALRRIRQLAAGNTAIHCVQFGRGPGAVHDTKDNFMYRLAEQNGGGYGYVDLAPLRRSGTTTGGASRPSTRRP